MDYELKSNDSISFDEELNPNRLPFDIVDFSPLYKNLHMNQLLVSYFK